MTYISTRRLNLKHTGLLTTTDIFVWDLPISADYDIAWPVAQRVETICAENTFIEEVVQSSATALPDLPSRIG